jgi:hypothetical protein
VGVPFCSLGRQNFCGSLGLLNSLWANVRRWARFLKISNFSEIEFSFRVPLHYFRLNNFFEIEAKNNEALKPAAC